MSFDLVIFDCDGVLVDSELIACKVEAEAYTKLGYEIDWMTMAERFAGMSSMEIMETICDELDQPPNLHLYENIQEEMDARMASELQVIAGAEAVLKEFSPDCCICSNSGIDRLKANLSKFGLWEAIESRVYSSREVGDKKPKPSPSVFLHAAAAFETDPKHCIVLEDSTHGIEGARAAGMRVVGFTGAGHTYPGHADALMEAGAETVITRLTDFPATVDALAGWDGIS